MEGGVWTFDGFVAEQDATAKKVGVRTLREDWPHDVGAVVFEALQDQAIEQVVNPDVASLAEVLKT
jgi:hypothetical protein